ncbi:M15 family metallopeptidase [Faecalibacterium sp. HTF-128]|uniref:M15 family metallopeptidase n=1 Tax=Faecalibacterium wellingii TaxID=2929491 RepID=A0AB35Y638_9FIRM
MEPTSKKTVKPRMTREQYMRRKRLRLARNWAVLILICAAIVALMTRGILWLLPKANALLAGPRSFEAASYSGTDYTFDADDARLILVNANLPFAGEPSPTLAPANEDGTIQLEAEAADAYRQMSAAAAEDGVALVLSAAYEAQKQQYLEKGKTEEEAASLSADIQLPAECNEHGTGYAADILSSDYPDRDTGFDTTRAYEWLTAYAAEYGFILRYPEDRQAATGVVFEPWHWRYVGTENALAIRASGLSLEEFLALQKAS